MHDIVAIVIIMVKIQEVIMDNNVMMSSIS